MNIPKICVGGALIAEALTAILSVLFCKDGECAFAIGAVGVPFWLGVAVLCIGVFT